MTGIRELYELQGIDTEIDKRLRRAAQIDTELQESAQVLAARKDLEEQEALQRQAVEEQKNAEEAAESTRSRIASHESKMYGSEPVPPKELQNMTAEVARLKERLAALDANVIGLMEQTERARAEVERQKSVLKELETRHRAAQSSLLDEKNRIQAEVPEWRERRDQCASTIPPAILSTYDRLRLAKGGLAVAKVVRGTCNGCRIAVPSTLVQRARAGKQFVNCASCGRLLYAT